MEWNASYRMSANLNLQWRANGKWAVCPAASREDFEISPDALSLLTTFGKGATPEEVFQQLSESFELERPSFAQFVEKLILSGVLLDVSSNQPVTLGEKGFADLASHHSMLMDSRRVLAYKQAIEATVAGKEVLEIGCGTGILTLVALQAKARHVTVIEESTVAEVAMEMFRAHGVADRVTLLRGNSRDVTLARPAEVLIHELFGTDPLSENVLPTLQDALSRLLVPQAVLLPDRLEVFAYGLRASEQQETRLQKRVEDLRAQAMQYGVNVEPFLRAYVEQQRRNKKALPAEWNSPQSVLAAVMTQRARVMDLQLRQPNAVPAVSVPLVSTSSGTLGATLMYFTAHFPDGTELSTDPALPSTSWGIELRPLPENIEVDAGETLTLQAEVTHTLASQRLEWNVRKKGLAAG